MSSAAVAAEWRLQHVSIGVDAGGAEAARAFYGGLLGLSERALPDAVDAAAFIWYRIGDGLDLHLHVLSEDDPPARRAHFCVIVPTGLDELRDRLEGAGVETRDPALWPGRRCFYCRDPFGNQIEFAERPE